MSHGVEQITDFLRAVDRHLVDRASIVIIGGGAAAFHSATSTTYDVDTYNAIDEVLQRSNFLQLIELLFGELKRVEAERLLPT